METLRADFDRSQRSSDITERQNTVDESWFTSLMSSANTEALEICSERHNLNPTTTEPKNVSQRTEPLTLRSSCLRSDERRNKSGARVTFAPLSTNSSDTSSSSNAASPLESVSERDGSPLSMEVHDEQRPKVLVDADKQPEPNVTKVSTTWRDTEFNDASRYISNLLSQLKQTALFCEPVTQRALSSSKSMYAIKCTRNRRTFKQRLLLLTEFRIIAIRKGGFVFVLVAICVLHS